MKEKPPRFLPVPKFQRLGGRRSFLYKRRRREKPLLTGLAILAALTILAFLNKAFYPAPAASPVSEDHRNTSMQVRETASTDASSPTIQEAEPLVPSYEKTIEVTIKRGDNLFDVLRGEGLPASRIHELVAASRPIHDLGRLQRGQTFMLAFDERDGRVLKFETSIGSEHRLVVEAEGTQLHARRETLEFDIHHEVVSGTIEDSLFLAADRAELPPAMILELAEIFAWDIDFSVDMRKSDTFRVLFEKKRLDDQFVSYGRLLAAEITNKGQPFAAYYFRGSDGQTDYYDRGGSSLRKAFLKSPLNYKYISSHFSNKRFHPILKVYRPHLGVDYAAPTGTPTHSVGDGTIVYAGRKGGFGRYVEVRHNETYSTTYGHLHRFSKEIKSGARVTQGQVIGYVGSSGLSTGPHLDFRMLKNGTFINPLKVNLPDADPVKEKDMPAFQKTVADSLHELDDRGNKEKHPDTPMKIALHNA